MKIARIEKRAPDSLATVWAAVPGASTRALLPAGGMRAPAPRRHRFHSFLLTKVMAEHCATIHWKGDGGSFLKRRYSRAHVWQFDGGATVQASASPSNVPIPFSEPTAVDPEEAYVAAIASCHMLSFLFVAASQGFEVVAYDDAAIGRMTPNERGVEWVSSVELRPRVVYSPEHAPDAAQEANLHHTAHEQCYIANSVRTEVVVRSPLSGSR